MRQIVIGSVVLAGAAVLGCGPGSGTGKDLVAPKNEEVFQGVQCSAVRPQSEPDLMAWDPGSRANLSRLRSEGVVAVRYRAEGCNVELELLSNCIAQGKYSYKPYSATDTKVAHNAQQLFAALPIGAARLAGKVGHDKALRTDYLLVGMASLPPGTTYNLKDLKGTGCDRATHVVSTVYFGGFAVVAGETRTIEAQGSVFTAEAGTSSSGHVERIAREGSAKACQDALEQGTENPLCAAPLRIGLTPLEGVQQECPHGAEWDGNRCVAVAKANPTPVATTKPASATVTEPTSPTPPPASTAAPAPAPASGSNPVMSLRDPRGGSQRARATLVSEIQGLESLYSNTPRNSPDRMLVMRRLADTYAELESVAGREGADSIRAGANKAAIKYYGLIKEQYPSYSKLDEVLYYLGLEYELGSDKANARKSIYELIQKVPRSKYIPYAYLMFGEQFMEESQSDASKLELAKQAYEEALKYPPPENKPWGYAQYKLGLVHKGQASSSSGAMARALEAFGKAMEFGLQYASTPASAWLLQQSQTEIVPAYVAAGKPEKAWEFFSRFGRAETQCLAVAREYTARKSWSEAATVLAGILDHSTSASVCGEARQQLVAHRAGSGPVAVARRLEDKIIQKCAAPGR